MSRIGETFSRLKAEGGRGFIPFITAGDPNLEMTRALIGELGRAGATVIELGIPFTDPMADGPVIQRASERALRHRIGMADILQTVADARRETDVPIVLFSYYNPLLQFGLDLLAAEAERVGVDGILATDLTPEEADEFAATLTKHALDLIFLVAPTSTEARLRMVADRASGFIYAVSRTGITGAQREMSLEAEKLVGRVRQITNLPVAVGFGISSREQVVDVWRYADAAVVGSALVAEIEKQTSSPDLVREIGNFVRALLPEVTG